MPPKIITSTEDKKKIFEILEQFYRNPNKNYGPENGDKSHYAQYADFISEYVKPNSRILDLGSGSWRLPVYVAKRGYKVFGCDFFPNDIPREFKSGGIDFPCHFISGSGYLLPFKSESFDAVTTLTVLEHVIFVDKFLSEMSRVLKPNGLLIIKCPNWAGLNAPVRALISLIFMKKRYWQYEKISDAILGILRSFIWYFRILFFKSGQFVLIFPKLKDGSIDFKESDDDCVHLCQPLSLKKWLKNNDYRILQYNRKYGNSLFGRIFNSLFPSFATTNNIVGQKL